MALFIKQISSLHKITATDKAALEAAEELSFAKAIRGERVSYQIALSADNMVHTYAWAESDLGDCVRLYREKDVIVDLPARERITDENYLLTEQGYLPDVLIPLEEQGNRVFATKNNALIWVKIDVPADAPAGEHKVKVSFGTQPDHVNTENEFSEVYSAEFTVDVVATEMPEQKIIYTRWFYLDCIADVHNVPIFSEEHWRLIESYIAAAADVGINMLLVPVHTPPLDTEIGTRRPCVQLVDIEKVGDEYKFDFDKFHRYISLCKKHGIKYYEMAHMFSQWGAKCAPNIVVTENGVSDYMFGWHVAADSELYTEFLKQYISAISRELAAEGISENTYFHISDEPHLDQIDRYEAAHSIFKPLIGNSKIFDALSNIEFYEKGLVECPVTSISRINGFLPHKIENQWVYYCCGPERVYPNSFIAMPSARVRVLGFMCYKFDIKGFLHWGFNYYNSSLSRYKINPYLTTSADGVFPSGDGYIVYPGRTCAYPSVRGEVTYQAMQDIGICCALEARIGREAVVALIDEAAGGELRFDAYPADNAFLEDLRAKMINMLEML